MIEKNAGAHAKVNFAVLYFVPPLFFAGDGTHPRACGDVLHLCLLSVYTKKNIIWSTAAHGARRRGTCSASLSKMVG
jgi:hypothetical protein